jgi:hypothetical protein
MDERKFDRLIQLLGSGSTRRVILGAAAALPMISLAESEAASRRRKRKRRRKRRKRAGAGACPVPWLEIPQGCALSCANNISVCDSLGCGCYSSLYGQFCLRRVGNPTLCTATEDCAQGQVCQAGECMVLCQPNGSGS